MYLQAIFMTIISTKLINIKIFKRRGWRDRIEGRALTLYIPGPSLIPTPYKISQDQIPEFRNVNTVKCGSQIKQDKIIKRIPKNKNKGAGRQCQILSFCFLKVKKRTYCSFSIVTFRESWLNTKIKLIFGKFKSIFIKA